MKNKFKLDTPTTEWTWSPVLGYKTAGGLEFYKSLPK
jgi:hypothetical protein